MVTQKVELYGTARMLAGCPYVEVQVPDGASVRDVLRALGQEHPSLVGPVLLPDHPSLSTGYTVNINGLSFISDLDEPVRDADVLLVIPAAAGGHA